MTFLACGLCACRCGPCRGFTPQLIKTYNAARAAGREFEVVLIGSDRNEADFRKYHSQMPWLALPFPDRSVCKGVLCKRTRTRRGTRNASCRDLGCYVPRVVLRVSWIIIRVPLAAGERGFILVGTGLQGKMHLLLFRARSTDGGAASNVPLWNVGVCRLVRSSVRVSPSARSFPRATTSSGVRGVESFKLVCVPSFRGHS